MLYDLMQRPQPYACSPSIWTDEHIASQMLISHLSEENAAASYPPERRERICAYLDEALHLRAGSRLIDLGCGPGLYAQRFARKGVAVTGVDFSENSIAYATRSAQDERLPICYAVQDYRDPFGTEQFDAAMMVSEDYGVLSQQDRAKFLRNVAASLRAGGYFALDVTNDAVWKTLTESSGWYAEASGFMRPHPHVVLQKKWLFPQERAYCDAYAVVDDSVSIYYTHQTLFTPERIKDELENAGFCVERVLGGLDGAPYDADGLQIGIIARKVSP